MRGPHACHKRGYSGPRSQGKRKREVSRWTPPEEAELQKAVAAVGTADWTRVADAVGTRSARQCKEHYREVLRYGDLTYRRPALASAETLLLRVRPALPRDGAVSGVAPTGAPATAITCAFVVTMSGMRPNNC